MSIAVRFAEPGDFAITEAIENRADALLAEYLHAANWNPAPSAQLRAAAPGFTLLAFEQREDEVVGFAHVIEAEGLAHLEQISVLPEHGRRGHGGCLLEAVADEARRRGHARITLRSYADVPWNAPFYAKHGFVETEPRTGFHRSLVAAEERLGLSAYRRRIQMTRAL